MVPLAPSGVPNIRCWNEPVPPALALILPTTSNASPGSPVPIPTLPLEDTINLVALVE